MYDDNRYSCSEFRKETCSRRSVIKNPLFSILGFTQPFVVLDLLFKECNDTKNEGFLNRCVTALLTGLLIAFLFLDQVCMVVQVCVRHQ